MATTVGTSTQLSQEGLCDMLKRYNEIRRQPASSDFADEMTLFVGVRVCTELSGEAQYYLALRGPIGLNIAASRVEGVSLLDDLLALFGEYRLLRELMHEGAHEEGLRRMIDACLAKFGCTTLIVRDNGLSGVMPVDVEKLELP